MGIVITVDLGASTPGDIARAAKFMLEFIGYQEPSVAQTVAPAPAPFAEEVSDDTDALPQSVFGQFPYGHDPYIDGVVETPVPPEVAEFLAQPAAAWPIPASPAPVATFGGGLPPPPPGIEVDAQGVPWDSRIHAGSRAKVADGTWRQRRNLDPAVFTQVMAELRQTMGVERRAPTPPAPPVPAAVFAPAPPVPPIPAAPVPVPPVPFADSATPPAPPASSTPSVPGSAGAATTASPSSAPPPVVAAPPATPSSAPPPVVAAPPATPSSAALTFPELMKRITPAFAAKTLTQADIARACAKVGIGSLPTLASRPDLVGEFATELGIAL